MPRVKRKIAEDFDVPLDENWDLVTGQDYDEWLAERQEYTQQTRWRNLKAKCFARKIFEGDGDRISLMRWTAKALIALRDSRRADRWVDENTGNHVLTVYAHDAVHKVITPPKKKLCLESYFTSQR